MNGEKVVSFIMKERLNFGVEPKVHNFIKLCCIVIEDILAAIFTCLIFVIEK